MEKYDVIIAGAGSAGFVAAVQAGRLGAKVLLTEKTGMPGGIMTHGGNNDVAQFWAHGKQIIAGIGFEFIERLNKLGGANMPATLEPGLPHWEYGVRVNIPLAAALMDEMLLEAGVDLRYEQTLCSAMTEPCENALSRITSVLLTSKTGLEKISADCYVDCTGDGDLAVFAGAKFELGEPDELGLSLQPGTVRAFLGDMKLTDEEFARVDAAIKEALDSGELKPADVMHRNAKRLCNTRYNNINHISRFNGADSLEKTRANIEGRRCVARLIAVFKKAGIEPDIEMICPETAVRETRRIICDSYITAEDYIAAKSYEDGICTSFYPIDLHRDGTNGIQQTFLEFGKVPSIPLSAMTVKGISNLYVAGRCASGDRLANSAYRVKASCMAMGQACGAAAVLAAKQTGGSTREVSFDRLREVLKQNEAIVPEVR